MNTSGHFPTSDHAARGFFNSRLRVGIDLDNTLIDYRPVFQRLAVRHGLFPPGVTVSKEAVRNALLSRDGDDRRWQAWQAEAYGPGIDEARLFDGARDVLQRLHRAGIQCTIVSHKTVSANSDPGVALRAAAWRWLVSRGLAPQEEGPGGPVTGVFFEGTRADKLRRISELGCAVFIDDKVDLLTDRRFPTAVLAVHFAPEAACFDGRRHPVVCTAWWQIARVVFLVEQLGVAAALSVLRRLPACPARIEPLHRAGNNRVLKLVFDDYEALICKRYGRFSGDRFDTAAAEVQALRFFGLVGETAVPRLIFHDPQSRVTGLSCLTGSVVHPGAVTVSQVDEMARFLIRLYRLSRRPAARAVGEASRSRRCLRDYLSVVVARMRRLEHCIARGGVDARLVEIYRQNVAPLFAAVRRRFLDRVAQRNWVLTRSFPRQERMLSPSDFGWHNVLNASSGHLQFFDFEYFGWDDMAKLLADFVHHPANAIPWSLKCRLVETVCRQTGGGTAVYERWQVVADLIAYEWLLILLNIIDPDIQRQRLAAGRAPTPEVLITSRIGRVRERLSRMGWSAAVSPPKHCRRGGDGPGASSSARPVVSAGTS